MAEGDPRVLFVMNLVLSGLFATVVIWGLDFIGIVAFTPWNVASFALLVMALTYVVTR
ncbi:hypothetical protein [Haloplanus pelagicus]|jgi:hypothetical protein|uniref:hypothetical protein n=1 Tax=Haloplanus pelagicus TaxID=2949995 RepID=UPI00203A6549|nr:hypothetical protein [Haloplanus sp. HW8-1]